MNRSKETLTRNIRTRKDTETWWVDRIRLDKELKCLLDLVDHEIAKDIEIPIDKLFIIADEETSFFCWESIKKFANARMYRIPSFEYFKCVDYKRKYVKLSSISYLLDPDNNLKNTRSKVNAFMSRNKHINIYGVTNKMPSTKEVQKIFGSSLFLYFGHGTGEKYLPKNHYKAVKNKAAFIFGCSSSRLFCRPNFKRNGIALKYLETVNNFIGCLWDVTDKDLDIFSISFLEDLMGANKCAADIIGKNRQKMKLKYLNGAALVLWGLPIEYVYDN